MTDKSKKTDARGFWYDKENKKLFYDYIQTETRTLKEIYQEAQKTKEIALFYVDGAKAFVLTCKSLRLEVLTKKHVFKVKDNLKKNLKYILNFYNGATVFIKDGYYLIETWSN
ncbi:MAG: hypothetical protein ACTSPD_09860 [Promethearchaeota archaeon]